MNRNADIPDQPMDLMNCQPNKQEMLCQPPISLLSFLDYYLGIVFFCLQRWYTVSLPQGMQRPLLPKSKNFKTYFQIRIILLNQKPNYL